MNEISNFCSGDLCKLRPEAGAGAGAQPLARRGLLQAQQPSLGKDPQWVCHLECWDAPGLNATQSKWKAPPYQIANSLDRSPLGFKVSCPGVCWGFGGHMHACVCV